jgi:hypothetical protein
MGYYVELLFRIYVTIVKTWYSKTLLYYTQLDYCHNSSLELDQGKGLQRCKSRMSSGVTFHAPRSAKGCEGTNPHTPN